MTFCEAMTEVEKGEKVNRASYGNNTYYDKSEDGDTVRAWWGVNAHTYRFTFEEFNADDWYIVE